MRIWKLLTKGMFSRDGTNVERINFHDGIVGNVKNTLFPL
jgi:hypothetical protein